MPDIYLESESIKAKIKFSPDTDLITVDEKNSIGKRITYSIEELDILQEIGIEEITPQIHIVKKVFSGTVIRYQKPVS